MMKYFIYAIAAIHLGCSTSLGEETGFDRQLPAPDSIHIRGQMGEKSKKLKEFFKSGNFKQFYGYSNTVLSELNAMRRHGTMTREEACDMLWSLYLISGAPMYEAPDYDSVQPWPYKDERNNDIAAKSRVISALSIMDTKQMSRNLGIHEQRLKHLHAAYAAAIIKRLKSLHLPDFGKKETALKDEIIRSHPANPDGNQEGGIRRRRGSRPHRPNGRIQLQNRLPLPGEKRRGTQEKASAETKRRVTPNVHSLRHLPPPNQEKQPGQDGEPRSPYNHLHLPRMEPFLRGGTFIRS